MPTATPASMQMTSSARRYTVALPLVSWVTTGKALIATLVVPGKARHELLGLWISWIWRLCKKLRCLIAPQRCRQAPTVSDLDLAALAHAIPKAKVFGLFGLICGHGAVACFVRPNV